MANEIRKKKFPEFHAKSLTEKQKLAKAWFIMAKNEPLIDQIVSNITIPGQVETSPSAVMNTVYDDNKGCVIHIFPYISAFLLKFQLIDAMKNDILKQAVTCVAMHPSLLIPSIVSENDILSLILKNTQISVPFFPVFYGFCKKIGIDENLSAYLSD